MNKKQAIGFTLILLGVASFALALFQLNSYLTYNRVADYTNAQLISEYANLKNDPAQLATLGITADELEQYGPQLMAQLSKEVQSIYQQANALVPVIALDFVLAAVFCAAGVHLSRERG